MSEKTSTYKLEYFKRGSYYSALADYHRFVTMDYNLESYIGIVGVGVINGWTIQPVDGLRIRILPGTGLIEGFLSESPYVVKRRSAMVSGEQEVDAYPSWAYTFDPSESDVPEAPLTAEQRDVYISIVREYNPTFDPPLEIPDSFVKVVDFNIESGQSWSSLIDLADNTDNYIYARRLSLSSQPFPLLTDYPVMTLKMPVRSNYPDYESYRVAREAYLEQLAAVQNYVWFMSDPLYPHNNHFTEVEYRVSSVRDDRAQQVLLGKVITRRGNIQAIDVSLVDSLDNMTAQIQKFAQTYVVGHRHGGNQSYDPPKINLKTDIRETALVNYNTTVNQFTFSVLDNQFTDLVDGHKHIYSIDSSGNGITLNIVGTANIHFHKIQSYVVGSPEYNTYSVVSHIHNIAQPVETTSVSVNPTGTVQPDVWNADSKFIVYLNGKTYGTEASQNIAAYPDSKTIVLTGGIGASYNTYTSSFYINGELYTFTEKGISINNFVQDMIADFTVQYQSVLDTSPELNPFAYPSTVQSTTGQGGSTTVYTINNADIQFQCEAAQLMMLKTDDRFTLTSPAANNITIVLSNRASTSLFKDYDVYMEILGNVEVTGKLRLENLLFVNAAKIVSGTIDIRMIPFISHSGRMGDVFLPFRYPLITRNGIKYSVVPAITDAEMGHYHTLVVDDNKNGVTYDIMVGDDSVYYGTGTTGTQYFIAHVHTISGGNIASTSRDGLLQWQNDLAGSNTASSTSSHTHKIIYPAIGNNKTIYAIREDAYGHLYVGTSDGFIMVPSDPSYSITINGRLYYGHGNDLWQIIVSVETQYEIDTKTQFVLDESLYRPQLEDSEDSLATVGNSIILYGDIVVSQGQDTIMIQRIAYFKVPNFYVLSNKLSKQVGLTDIVLREIKVTLDDMVEVNPLDYIEAYPTEGDTTVEGNGIAEPIIPRSCYTGEDPTYFIIDSVTGKRVYICNRPVGDACVVRDDFNLIPVWSIDLKPVRDGDCGYTSKKTGPYEYWYQHTDIMVVGATLIGRNFDLDQTLYHEWARVVVPSYAGTVRKVIRDAKGDYWFASSNGILISRRYQNISSIDAVSIPYVDSNIMDMAEGKYGEMYCVSGDGVFKTSDGGSNWLRLSVGESGGFSQIVRDYSDDVSSVVNGHYHRVQANLMGSGFLMESH